MKNKNDNMIAHQNEEGIEILLSEALQQRKSRQNSMKLSRK
jgi:hypothetical protein